MDLVQLGGFLRSRRDRLDPADLGFRGSTRRRVPGLTRDEVATLAGASVDYYAQLEQARGTQPSEQMLAALCRAMRLTLDERDHLYHLAGRPLPPAGTTDGHVHPGMLALLDRLESTPAQVMTDLSVPLVQNRMAVALLGAPRHKAGLPASFVHQWFTEPDVRDLYHRDEQAHQSRVLVADVRAATARRGDDPLVKDLIDDLTARSAEFAELWDRQEVAVRRSDRKRLVHPTVGELDLTCLSLLSEDGGQRLLWFVPNPGTPAAERLELLGMVGAVEARSGG